MRHILIVAAMAASLAAGAAPAHAGGDVKDCEEQIARYLKGLENGHPRPLPDPECGFEG